MEDVEDLRVDQSWRNFERVAGNPAGLVRPTSSIAGGGGGPTEIQRFDLVRCQCSRWCTVSRARFKSIFLRQIASLNALKHLHRDQYTRKA